MYYLFHSTLKAVFTFVAFAMVLVLTPRVFVDDGQAASSSEIPLRALEPPDTCLWCTPEEQPRPSDCPDGARDARIWVHPDKLHVDEGKAPCAVERPASAPGA